MSIKKDRSFQVTLYPDDFSDRDIWEYFVRRLLGVDSEDVKKIEMVDFDCVLTVHQKANKLWVE